MTRGVKLSLGGMLLLFVIFGLAISQVTPFNKGNDEGNNLRYLEFIITTGRLPVTYEERELVGPEGNWPALYHLILGLPSRALGVEVDGPPVIKIFWDSFRYRTLDLGEEEAWYLLSEDQAWPYYGRILVLHSGRWLSIFFGVVNLILIFMIVLEILPRQYWPALFGVGLLAFIPAYIFISSVLNEDSLVAALASLYFLALIKAIKAPDKLWLYVVMGLALGLSVTAKYTTVIFPLEVIVVVAVLAYRRGVGWGWWLRRVAIVGGCAILASSWWFGWNLWHLNQIDELGFVPGILSAFFEGGTDETLGKIGYVLSGGQIGLAEAPTDIGSGTFGGWLQTTFLSMWGVSIGQGFPAGPYGFVAVIGLLAAAAFGLWRLDEASRRWLWLMSFHLVIVFVLPLLDFFSNRRLGKTAQGRHIFIPAAAAIVILIVWGLKTALPPKWQRVVFPAIIVGLMSWTALHVVRLDALAGELLPYRTLPQAAAWLPETTTAQFGEALELVSYGIEPRPDRGELGIGLAFRSLAHTSQSYLLEVTLTDAQDRIVSHWRGHTGRGRVPTLAWDPGDVVFERLTLPLPNLPAGDYRLTIGFLDQFSHAPIDQAVDLPVSLDAPAQSIHPPPENSEGIAYRLWQAEGPVSDGRPRYRYPATIGLVADPGSRPSLIDESGRRWPPDRSEANLHTFVIGPRWPSGDYRLQVDSAAGERLTDQPVLTVENWWERHFTVPEAIEVPTQANFANQLKFLGYSLPQKQVKAGQSLPVTLVWQAPSESAPQAHFIQFNNLLDSSGTVRGGYDRVPLEYYSTLLWAPGEVVVDGYTIPVDADAPPGDYYLNVGYYLPVGESAVTLPLVVDNQMSDRSSVSIGPIKVVEP